MSATQTPCAHCDAPYMRSDTADPIEPDHQLCPDCADRAVWGEECPECERIPGRRPCRPVPRSDLAEW